MNGNRNSRSNVSSIAGFTRKRSLDSIVNSSQSDLSEGRRKFSKTSEITKKDVSNVYQSVNKTPKTMTGKKQNNSKSTPKSLPKQPPEPNPKPISKLFRMNSPTPVTQSIVFSTSSENEKTQNFVQQQKTSSMAPPAISIASKTLSSVSKPTIISNSSTHIVNQQFQEMEIEEELNFDVVTEKLDFVPTIEDFDFGLPYSFKEILLNRGIYTFHDWQYECLTKTDVLNGGNLVYSLPTSGGKTFVSEVVMIRNSFLHKKISIFILPFVSIVLEKEKSLREFGKRLNFRVEAFYQNSGTLPLQPNTNQICVCTIEKANMILNSLIEEDRIDEIATVVIDELHMLGEPARGYLIESFVIKLKNALENYNTSSHTNPKRTGNKNTNAQNKKKAPKIQLIGMSATLPNLNDIANWIKSKSFVRYFRPVPLHEYIKQGPQLFRVSRNPSQSDRIVRQLPPPPNNLNINLFLDGAHSAIKSPLSKDDLFHLFTLVNEVVPFHSVLVFCSSKALTVKLAQFLSNLTHRCHTDKHFSSLLFENQQNYEKWLEIDKKELLAKPGDHDHLLASSKYYDYQKRLNHLNEERNDLIKRIKSSNPKGFIDPLFSECLLQGVAFHNSSVSNLEREMIEAAFRERIISVICCTTTLAAGVNLPARRVIISSLNTGIEPLTTQGYRQMAGRAGRAGIDTFGESFVFAPSFQSRSQAANQCYEPSGLNQKATKIVKSDLDPVLSCLNVKFPSQIFFGNSSNANRLRQTTSNLSNNSQLSQGTSQKSGMQGSTSQNSQLNSTGIPEFDPETCEPNTLSPSGIGIDRLVLEAVGAGTCVTRADLINFFQKSFLASTSSAAQIERMVSNSIAYLVINRFMQWMTIEESEKRRREDSNPGIYSAISILEEIKNEMSNSDSNTVLDASGNISSPIVISEGPENSLSSSLQISSSSNPPLRNISSLVSSRPDKILYLTTLGSSTYKSCLGVEESLFLRTELEMAQRFLNLETDLHLCYLVTPLDANILPIDFNFGPWSHLVDPENMKPHQKDIYERVGANFAIIKRLYEDEYYKYNSAMKAPGWLQTKRFVMALILERLVAEENVFDIAKLFGVARGEVEMLMINSSMFANQIVSYCRRMRWWAMELILKQFAVRVRLGVKEELIPLMKIRGVKAARARVLFAAGYRTIRSVALAQDFELEKIFEHIGGFAKKLARNIIIAAQKLLEKTAQELRDAAKAIQTQKNGEQEEEKKTTEKKRPTRKAKKEPLQETTKKNIQDTKQQIQKIESAVNAQNGDENIVGTFEFADLESAPEPPQVVDPKREQIIQKFVDNQNYEIQFDEIEDTMALDIELSDYEDEGEDWPEELNQIW